MDKLLYITYSNNQRERGCLEVSQLNIRLDDVHKELLNAMVEKLKSDGVKTDKTDIVKKALYSFARDNVLGSEKVTEIIDKNYKGFW